MPFVQTAPSSLSKFLKIVEGERASALKAGSKADLLFRGQNTDEPLLPRIARLKPKGSLPKVERLMMEEFKRQIPPFTEFEPSNDWDLLALAQHHGLPTRLLDWSLSALAGLWFCVRRPPMINEQKKPLDGVVWVLKSRPDDFTSTATPYDAGRTRVFRPRIVTRRILAQNGVFTCHKPTKRGRYVALEDNPAYKARLSKIPIRAQDFKRLREQLIANGVSSLALFPDLDGLAAHLSIRYFHNAKPTL